MTIPINELFLLKNFFTGASTALIQESIEKKNFRSQKDYYKPGSEKYLEELERERLNSEKTCIDIKFDNSELQIGGEYGGDSVKFSIGNYTDIMHDYNCDGKEHHSYEVSHKFLIDDEYDHRCIICSFDELLMNDSVKHLLMKAQQEQFEKIAIENVLDLDEVFSLVQYHVVAAMKEFAKVDYYTEYNHRGKCIIITKDEVETTFFKEDLLPIHDAYKKDVRFYDDCDRKIEFYDCCHNVNRSYYEYYIKHAPKGA